MAFFSKDKIGEKFKQRQEVHKQHTILIVDDDEPNLRSLSRLLEREYELLTARDGQEALDLVKNAPDPSVIHLIISDQRMPNLTGVEFLKQTIPIIPKTIRMLLTGFTDIDAIIDSINEGHIYKFITKPYDPDDLKVTVQRALESFDLEKNNLELLTVFEKFVPKQFLSRIAPEGLQYLQFGKAKSEKLSILFAGIHSFSSLSETMTPQELLDFLNTYSQQISQSIHHHHGFIDKFMGAHIMALFDRVDQTREAHAQDAVQAAIGMQKSMNEYNLHRTQQGLFPIEIGIGVHTGEIIVGTMGSEGRMDSTALGDSVNLAFRLDSLTTDYEAKILISDAIYRLLDERKFQIREIDTTRVKGKVQPVTVYEIFDVDASEIREKKQATREPLEQGIQHLNALEFQPALACFETCLSVFPQDVIAKQYMGRVNYMNKYFHSHEANLILRQFKNNLQELMRREFEPFECHIPARLSLVNQEEGHESQIINLSKIGMLIETQWLLDLYMTIVIEVAFVEFDVDNDQPVNILGRVVRKTGVDETSPVKNYGVEFIQVSPKDKETLYQVLKQLELNQ